MAVSVLLAQHIPYSGPNDPAGDPAAVRTGVMDGNRVMMQFRNTSDLSDWGTQAPPYSSKWPNDYMGSRMTDGIYFLAGARVYIEKNVVVAVTCPSIRSQMRHKPSVPAERSPIKVRIKR